MALLFAGHARSGLGDLGQLLRYRRMGRKGQNLILPDPRRLEILRHKRCIIDRNAYLFDWSDEEIFVVVLAQNGREQPNKAGSANGRTKIKPCAVACDAHV